MNILLLVVLAQWMPLIIQIKQTLSLRNNMSAPKQVIILRKDLNMRKGKMVAQGAHASMAVILNMMTKINDRLNLDPMPTAMKEWFNGSFTKICVSVNSEQDLLDIHQTAVTAGIPCALIKDSGFTEFNGVPTYTAVAIGPDYPEVIDPITKHLSLL